jgi:tagatose-6-phosphate ketose/aldose isomerase
MDMFGLSAAQLESAGAHWTSREVLQQPELWPEVGAQIIAHRADLDTFLDPLRRKPDLRILLTGAGTSAYIGECLSPALVRAWAARVDSIATTDLVADPATHLSAKVPTLAVSFARSGNSPESLAALQLLDQHVPQVVHLVVTCNPDGVLYQRACGAGNARAILLPARSHDRSFAMTSSFTGMLWAAGCALHAVPPAAVRAASVGRLAQRAVSERLALLRQLVQQKFERVVYLGAGEFKGLAREAALKMLELTDGTVAAFAETPLGFRHGPKTVLNRNTLVVLFTGTDPHARRYDADLLTELRGERIAGKVIALCASDEIPAHPDNVVIGTGDEASHLSNLELCLPYALFAQSLALLRSLSLGVRPDSPNAAGTVSRVVKGVTIYPYQWQRTA